MRFKRKSKDVAALDSKDSIEFPPQPFPRDLRIKIPTKTEVWEGSLEEIFDIDVDNPRPKLAKASGLEAFFTATRAYMWERVTLQKDAIELVEARVKKRLLTAPPKDNQGNPIRMTGESLKAWIITEPAHEEAVRSLRQLERLLEIIDQSMWTCKSWNKSLQILATTHSQERGVDRPASYSTDSSQHKGTSDRYKGRHHRLEDQVDQVVNNQGGTEDHESEEY